MSFDRAPPDRADREKFTMKYLVLAIVILSGCSWENCRIANVDKVGTHIETTAFAFLPMLCPDGRMYWLQTLRVTRSWEVPTPFSGIREFDNCIGPK